MAIAIQNIKKYKKKIHKKSSNFLIAVFKWEKC